MKRIYLSFFLVVLCFLYSSTSSAQNPCSGPPGTNTVMPMNHTVCANSVANMSLALSYTNSGITYQWQSSNVSPVGPWTSIPGATLSTYTSPPLTGTMYYNVIITCTLPGGAFISVVHTVTVVACVSPCNGTPGTNSVVPATQTICAGSTGNMSLATTYSDTGFTYQWGASTSPGGPFTPISGATLTSYSTPTLSGTMYYQIVITCTNGGLTFTTGNVVSVVQCTACNGTPGSNTIIPLNYTVCYGSSASMSLANTYTLSGYTYQWQSSSVSAVGPFASAPGATLSTYVTPTLGATMYYNVVITCINGGAGINVPTTVQVFTCTTVGIINGVWKSNDIKIFPNPNNGEFTVEWNNNENVVEIFLTDVMGRVVLQTSATGKSLIINMKNFLNGIYYLQLRDAQTVRIEKIFKE